LRISEHVATTDVFFALRNVSQKKKRTENRMQMIAAVVMTNEMSKRENQNNQRYLGFFLIF